MKYPFIFYQSKTIDSVAWDQNVMYVKFKNKNLWAYFNVPEQDFIFLVRSHALEQNIRVLNQKFAHQQVV